MRRRTAVLTAVAGGAIATSLAATAAIAAPLTAATVDPTAQPTSATGNQWCRGADQDDQRPRGNGQGAANRGTGPGNGMGYGNRRNGMANGTGNGNQGGSARAGHAAGQNLPASGTLTAAQLADLGWMAEEEKLAHDVYVALAEVTGDTRFTRIASAESRHLDAVRTLLARYDQADPTEGRGAGEFADAELAALYPKLVEQGSTSLAAALEVGRTIERMDIADLTEKLDGLSAPDVEKVYGSLLAGSQNHLRAFGG